MEYDQHNPPRSARELQDRLYDLFEALMDLRGCGDYPDKLPDAFLHLKRVDIYRGTGTLLKHAGLALRFGEGLHYEITIVHRQSNNNGV